MSPARAATPVSRLPSAALRLYRFHPGRMLLAVFSLSFASALELLGIATILPLIGTVAGSTGPKGRLQEAVYGIFETVGLPATLETMLAVVVASMVLKGVVTTATYRYASKMSADLAGEFRRRLLTALLKVRWPYFVDHPISSSVATLGLETVRAAALMLELCRFLSVLLLVVVYAIFAAFIGPELAVAALVITIITAASQWNFVRQAGRAGSSQSRAMASLSKRVAESLQGMKAMKAMGREGHVLPFFIEEATTLQEAQRFETSAREALRSLREPLVAVLLGVGLYVAIAYMKLPIERVLFLGVVFFQLTRRSLELQSVYVQLRSFEASFWAVVVAIDDAERNEERIESGPVPTFTRELSIENISFNYGSHRILDDCSATFPSRAFVAIVGSSGAGKTTLIDLLIGLQRPSSGRIVIDGHVLGDSDLTGWRSRLGYVPQETFLFNDTLRINVTCGAEGMTDADVERALRLAGAWDFVCRLQNGLDTMVGERGLKLSGGQRQRIAIARAILSRPQLLILDEATTALDPETERGILETLRGLASETTVVAISHSPLILEYATVCFQLQGGRLSQAARPSTSRLHNAAQGD